MGLRNQSDIRRTRNAIHAIRSAIEPLDSRLLLASITVTADVNDRAIRSDGTSPFVGDQSMRVGDNGTNVTEQAGVFPFKLPVLPAGATITGATANFTLQSISNAGSVTGAADLYGLGHRSTSTVLAGDYYEGAYNGDATDATAIQTALAVNTTPAGPLTMTSAGNTALKNYVASQYAAGGADKFAFLRINAQQNQLTSRFWVIYSANAATISQRPTITITYETEQPPAAPTNVSSVTTGSSTIRLNWSDVATNETGYAIEKSTDGVNWTAGGSVGANATSHDVALTSADTKYFLRVRATGNVGDSAWSSVISNTTLPSFTRTLWIDKSYTGTTANGGFATPYKSIASAMTAAVAGDGLVIRGGTYYETVNVKSGTTLMSQPNERAILSGFGAISGWTSIGNGVYKTTVNFNPNTLYVGNDPMDLSRSPNEGWWVAPTVTDPTATTTMITDPAHLAGIPSLVGGYVQMHHAAGNDYKGAQIIAHDTVNGTITFNLVTALANNDRYMIKNKPELLDRPGEWATMPSTTAGQYDILFRPINAADLNSTQARKSTSRQVLVNNSATNVTIRGLEVTGNQGNGIEINGNASYVTVRDNTVHNNGAGGIYVRYASNITVKNNLSLANKTTGIVLASVTGAVVDRNEVAWNNVDGIVAAGDISGKQPGAVGFAPSSDVVISNNYIHHHLGYAHADGIQMYRWISDVHVLNNFIAYSSQALMTEEVDNAELAGNVIWNAAAYINIFGHANSNNWNVHNNTIGGSGYGPYSMTGVGYQMRENVVLGQVSIPSITGSQYTGDRNLYYNPLSTTILRTSSPSKNYTSVATFFADTGQDQNSASGNPLLTNAPAFASVMENMLAATTTSMVLRSVTGFAVGDKIQINGDGVVRTVTAVNTTTKTITYDVPVSAPPLGQYWIVENWKTNTNFSYDFALASGSPGLTLSATGGRVGSLVSASGYQNGDFNNDGQRDIPTLFSDIAIGLPNPTNWPPPSF